MQTGTLSQQCHWFCVSQICQVSAAAAVAAAVAAATVWQQW